MLGSFLEVVEMGCLTSTEVPPSNDYDIVHTLSDEQRWEYLACGFAREHEINCNCTISIDIKLLFSKYISNDRIWSMKELDWKEFGKDKRVEWYLHSLTYLRRYCLHTYWFKFFAHIASDRSLGRTTGWENRNCNKISYESI